MNRILIVEDDTSVLRMMQVAMELEHEVETARTGRDALQKYYEARNSGKPFHALLLDVHLADDESGIAVAQTVRESGDNETRIIFLTAITNEDGPRLAAVLNAHWLRKPEDMGLIEELLTQ